MTIEITCSQCQTPLRVAAEMAGKKGRCPNCQMILPIPAPRRPAAPRPPAQPATALTAKPLPRAKSLPQAPPAARAPASGNIVQAELASPSPAAAAPLNRSSRPSPSAALSPGVVANKPAGVPGIQSYEQLRAAVMAGFQGPIERVPTAQGYQLGIVMIAGFMLLLPLLYFGLIALVAAGIGLTLMRGAGNPVVFILSLLAAALLLVLLVFMLKPLFARRAGGRRIRSLIPDSDPLLFEFVRRICILVQAPPPARIDIDCDVNASAGFDGGFRGLLSNDLVLTIGLPLAAGLSLQQVGGVLAHEFGHFSQGAGMRLTFVVRSINHWFLRAVYERDRWDDWLTY